MTLMELKTGTNIGNTIINELRIISIDPKSIKKKRNSRYNFGKIGLFSGKSYHNSDNIVDHMQLIIRQFL